MASGRLLIKDGHVLTLDPSLGDLERADVLIEDGRIAAVEPALETGDCEVLDVAGKIVMPGFVDTHRHTWQTALRGICADWTLQDYFRGIRLNISTELSPEDIYAGNYVGALEALDAGVTSLLDFSHCNNSPAHADEAIRGLEDAGLRAVFAYGFYPVPLAEPFFDEPRRADRGRAARALRPPALRRRTGSDGHRADRARTRPVRRNAPGDRDRARARCPGDRPHRLGRRSGLAAGDRDPACGRACSMRGRCTSTAMPAQTVSSS